MTKPYHSNSVELTSGPTLGDWIGGACLVAMIAVIAHLPVIMADPTVSLTAPAEASE